MDIVFLNANIILINMLVIYIIVLIKITVIKP